MLPELQTERLTLRPAAESDLDALWALWTDPAVRRFLFDDVAVSRERAAEVLADCRAQMADGLGLWVILTRDRQRVIGCAGLMPVGMAVQYEPRLAGEVEPLVALDPALWHQGFATEALAAAIGYAFGPRDLPRLAGVTDIPNEASHRLLLRLGFEVLGECDGPTHRMRTYRLMATSRPQH
ncbi:MAG TPA: GNAT family N-acetyltransferase [Thermoanaerobaculia bacterium]|nr:GNAT family N-acetyltransferase [Thermoanaerobaculia bacterium]